MKLKFRYRTAFFAKVLCAGCCIIALVSCAIGVSPPASYPNELPEVRQVQGNDCPDISGQYNNTGKLYFYDILEPKWVSAKTHKTLGTLLLGSQETDTLASMVTISQGSNDTIEVSSTEDNKTVINNKQLLRAKNDYSCDEEGIKLSLGSEKTRFKYFIASTIEYTNLFFYKGVDDSLLVRRSTKGFGLVLWVVPFVYGHYYWYRFEPAERMPQEYPMSPSSSSAMPL